MPIIVDVKDNAHISQIATANGKRDWRLVWDQCGLKGKHKNPHILFKADQVRMPGGGYAKAFESVYIPDDPPTPTTKSDKSSGGRGPSLLGLVGGKSSKEKSTPPKRPTQSSPSAEQALVKDDQQKNESGATEKKHTFVVPTLKLELRLRILDGRHQPLKDATYSLQLDQGQALTGSLNPDGSLEVKIANSTQNGVLTVWWTPPPPPGQQPPTEPAPPLRSVFILEIGKLNPILEPAPDLECISGVQARLNNMGFLCGEVDGMLDPATQGAIDQFQRRFGMTVNSQSDAALQQKLESLHDRNTPCPPPRPAPPPTTGAQATTGVAPTDGQTTRPDRLNDNALDGTAVPQGRPRPMLAAGGRTAPPKQTNTNGVTPPDAGGTQPAKTGGAGKPGWMKKNTDDGATPQTAQTNNNGATEPAQTGTPPDQTGTPTPQTGGATKPSWMKK